MESTTKGSEPKHATFRIRPRSRADNLLHKSLLDHQTISILGVGTAFLDRARTRGGFRVYTYHAVPPRGHR
jgi:hypothetical protein